MDWRKLPGMQKVQPSPQASPQQQAILDQFQQHQQEVAAKNAAQMVVDKYKDEQRRIFSSIVGMRVHDIIEFNDHAGDDQIATVFGNYRGRDFQENDRAVVQLLNLEQTRMSVVFIEVVYRSGKFWDLKTGQNFMLAAQRGSYAPVMLPKDVERVYAATAEGRDPDAPGNPGGSP